MSEDVIDKIPLDPSPTSVIKPIIKEVAPIGIEAVKMMFTGKKIMICGPQNAGKSHFKDYFIYDLLLPEMEDNEREPTFDFEFEKRKLVKFGKTNNLSFRIKKFIDSPGELDCRYQVKKIEKNKPVCLIIYLDCSSYENGKKNCESLIWFKRFASFLKNALTRNQKFNKKLKSIVIVLNKFDTIQEDDYKKLRKYVEKIKDQYLTDSFVNFQYKNRNIPIFRCISVVNKDSRKYLNQLINSIISRIK